MDQRDIDIAGLRQQNAKLKSENARLKAESIERQRQWNAFLGNMATEVGKLPQSTETELLLAHVKGVKLMGWDTALGNQNVPTTEPTTPIVSAPLVSQPQKVKEPKTPPPPPPPVIEEKKEDDNGTAPEHSDSGPSPESGS